jgi:hypothetical protein
VAPIIKDDEINADAYILKSMKIQLCLFYKGVKLRPLAKRKEPRLWMFFGKQSAKEIIGTWERVGAT